MLRIQQERLRLLTEEILSGFKIEEIFLPWAVGGGKSLAPVILSDLLIDGKKQIVVIPRNTLRQQGEAEYCNDIYPVDKTARIASNVGDPFRGCDSCFVTYQGIASDPGRWINVCLKYDVMLVLDECHHLSKNGDWITGIQGMKELSFLTVFLTGTAFRGDDSKLPFFPYNKDGSLDKRDYVTRRWIEYPQSEALSDGSVLDFTATTIDGSGKYIDLDGITRKFNTLGDKGDHLRCVFDSEYAEHFLNLVFSDWLEYRNKFPKAKILIVAKDINTAEKYTEYIGVKYPSVRSGIATSADTVGCLDVIKRSKMDNSQRMAIECLVSVGICYEGLNIPAITHEAVMTVIRSLQWLQQCLGRCTRNCKPWKTEGFVYAPADKKMIEVLRMISTGEIKAANLDDPEQQSKQTTEIPDGLLPARKIQALESSAHIPNQRTDYIPKQETQSEIEHRLRKEINSIVNGIVSHESSGNIKTKQRILWLRIKQIVNDGRDENGKLIKKSIDAMTTTELKRVADYVRNYKK